MKKAMKEKQYQQELERSIVSRTLRKRLSSTSPIIEVEPTDASSGVRSPSALPTYIGEIAKHQRVFSA
jgi:hypothetical protein